MLCCTPMGFYKCVMSCPYHFSSIQSCFTAPKIPCASPIHPSFLQSKLLATTDLHYLNSLASPSFLFFPLLSHFTIFNWSIVDLCYISFRYTHIDSIFFIDYTYANPAFLSLDFPTPFIHSPLLSLFSSLFYLNSLAKYYHHFLAYTLDSLALTLFIIFTCQNYVTMFSI